MSDQVIELKVPDIGGAADVDVIEILVSVGDSVAVDDPLVTLEGDKASMEIPAVSAGVVKSIALSVGDKVSEGDLICSLAGEASSEKSQASDSPKDDGKEEASSDKATKDSEKKEESDSKAASTDSKKTSSTDIKSENEKSQSSKQSNHDVHASPAVRRLARELEVNLQQISGSGDKGRITKEDLKRHLSGGSAGGNAGFSLPKAPAIDFAKFGEIESKPLSKIQKISGANLHRNWVSIPHVTQFGEADITDMESFRQSKKDLAAKKGYKLTPLVFIMKAVVAALKAFPHFNASLDQSGESLVMKKYFHIGVAVDTPNGLVVPVIRDVDQKSLFDLAKELGEISTKAREKGLSISEMQGGCFTISSLGGIGGTAFTPIINAPEVAILGVSKSSYKPEYKANGEFDLKFMLPLSLSYDHRVIDGADGARFMVYLSQCLSDIRTLLL